MSAGLVVRCVDCGQFNPREPHFCDESPVIYHAGVFAMPPRTLSEFVHATPEAREAIGEGVASLAFARQAELLQGPGPYPPAQLQSEAVR